MGKITVTKLSEGLWQFHESEVDSPGDAYLVCGKDRCVMVDSLHETEELYAKAREICDLPMDLVLTHGHLDHVGKATDSFKQAGCGVYLKKEDEAILGTMGAQSFPKGYFQDLQAGQRFELGGRVLDVILMPGHTAGSIALLDRENQILISADSIGSGPFWLQLPHSLSMETFIASTSALLEEVKDMESLLVLPGHRIQSPTPLGLAYVKDTLETAELILDGTLKGEPGSLVFEGVPMTFRMSMHKSMLGFFYNPDRLLNAVG